MWSAVSKVAAPCRTNCTFDVLVSQSFIQRNPSPITSASLPQKWKLYMGLKINNLLQFAINEFSANKYSNEYSSSTLSHTNTLVRSRIYDWDCKLQMFCNAGSDARRGLATFNPDGRGWETENSGIMTP